MATGSGILNPIQQCEWYAVEELVADAGQKPVTLKQYSPNSLNVCLQATK